MLLSLIFLYFFLVGKPCLSTYISLNIKVTSTSVPLSILFFYKMFCTSKKNGKVGNFFRNSKKKKISFVQYRNQSTLIKQVFFPNVTLTFQNITYICDVLTLTQYSDLLHASYLTCVYQVNSLQTILNERRIR